MAMKAKVKFWVQCSIESCRKSVQLDKPWPNNAFICEECSK